MREMSKDVFLFAFFLLLIILINLSAVIWAHRGVRREGEVGFEEREGDMGIPVKDAFRVQFVSHFAKKIISCERFLKHNYDASIHD